MLQIIFFGSFQSYSVQVLEALTSHPKLFNVSAVVTTPPRPAGREMKPKPTEVATFAQNNHLLVFALESLDNQSLDKLKSAVGIPDFFVVAGYGKLLPPNWLKFPKIAPINLHFSLLPAYPGRCPAEWTILKGESQTGVTLIKMSEQFDRGEVISQEKMPILPSDSRETLYQKLYELGSGLSVKILPEFAKGKLKPTPQDRSKLPKYARQITREDGFLPLQTLKAAIDATPLPQSQLPPLFKEISPKRPENRPAKIIERMVRAFTGWPGVWTEAENRRSQEKTRIKILKTHLEDNKLKIDELQIEGRKPIKDKDAQNFLKEAILEKIQK